MAERIAILTGGIGSGKSLVADMFRQLGVCVVDADVIAHEITAAGGPAIEAVRAALGDSAIAADGSMDRASVRAMIFSDAAIRERLEGILHPMIRDQAREMLRRAPGVYAIYVIPLWWELRQRPSPDIDPWTVIDVDCDEETQISRVMSRNGLSRDEVLRIMAAQATREERRSQSDHIILNQGSAAETETLVKNLHQRLIHS
jgi:dephospho-CoA kinase